MSGLANFAFEEHLVRVVERDGEPWFAGKDVCRCLEIEKHHQALDSLDGDERGTCTVGTPSGHQTMVVISEPGVYRLVFRSRKPAAERFKRWLAHEVIPAIRRTGRYETTPAAIVDTEAPLMAKVAAVRLALRLFGRDNARALWHRLELPAMDAPASDAEAGARNAAACLDHLLAARIEDGLTIRAAIGAGVPERDALFSAGLGIVGPRTREEGFQLFVPNQHPALSRHFSGTPWADGRWNAALAGGRFAWTRRTMRIPGGSKRGIGIDLAAIAET
ncbi:Bro-N domain-containing protein [Jiella avicenniae]|uniref:Bro-N domain-containing protein n=1 Tax=Jiella avicenniae TaxID=2907202 RepID=A0A9X1NYG0_9HYPH|nr:BRO family protein [Jiella avicenniae]MCE7026434.1 hypothetical protein [Jiella avicenniae]